MAYPATRLIICVDGTSSHTPAGSFGETNVHRIYASIQHGICIDGVTGETFNQEVQYIPWLNHTDNLKDRIQIGACSQGYVKKIEEVYNRCSQLTHKQDELWLFGFGHGGIVVRAVAGLLHNFGTMASAGQDKFGDDFKRLLEDMQGVYGLSPASFATGFARTAVAPRIQFVGVFDPISSKYDHKFDTSFNPSIRNMRQAVALHEDKESVSPALLFPADLDSLAPGESGRSFQQAYFVGRHNDLGGSAKRCGLSLYPCQWMWLEARKCGLAVNVAETLTGDNESLSALLPRPEREENKSKARFWSFTSENGIITRMQDLRDIHRNSADRGDRYSVRLGSPWMGSVGEKKLRSPFDADGRLRGYCERAPQGTLIHPSVYLLLDEYIHIALESKESKLHRHIEDWRSRMMHDADSIGANTGFWLEREDDDNDAANPGAFRVLVCGNTGVGKSSLINKIFGVDVTQSSHRARGIHDVREEITWEGRPDLIVHDSGGFEAGTDDELLAIEEFLKERADVDTVLARVHIIWFCVDINSPRTLQSVTEKLFSAVSRHAKDVPVMIVTTKKDQLLDVEFGARRKMLKKEGRPFDEEECERYATEMQGRRLDLIRGEMQCVPGGRLDACLAVSLDDEDSIAQLSGATSHCFDTDSIRLLYIRAQITRIGKPRSEVIAHFANELEVADLKVDMAQAEILKRYKRLVRRSATTLVPLGATITRKVSHAKLTSSIMRCFGLPTITAEAALEVFKANLCSTTSSNVQLAFAEAFQLIGLSCTGLTLGSPIWLVTGGINAAHVVPTTCRLLLVMACDMTWVLARSFKEARLQASVPPDERGIRSAAYDYIARGHASHVHGAIKTLIPKKDPLASFKLQNVQLAVEALLNELRDDLKCDDEQSLNDRVSRNEGRVASIDADSDIFLDAQAANATLAELEAGGRPCFSELDGTGAIFELPAGGKDFRSHVSAQGPNAAGL